VPSPACRFVDIGVNKRVNRGRCSAIDQQGRVLNGVVCKCYRLPVHAAGGVTDRSGDQCTEGMPALAR
jgi:hypothetical protein